MNWKSQTTAALVPRVVEDGREPVAHLENPVLMAFAAPLVLLDLQARTVYRDQEDRLVFKERLDRRATKVQSEIKVPSVIKVIREPLALKVTKAQSEISVLKARPVILQEPRPPVPPFSDTFTMQALMMPHKLLGTWRPLNFVALAIIKVVSSLSTELTPSLLPAPEIGSTRI
jgi:hypothetical protein